MHVISRNCSIWAANFCVTHQLYDNATRNTAQESYFSRGLLILFISRWVACGRRKTVQCSARSDTYCISLQTVRADRSSSTSCTARRNSLVLWQFSYLGMWRLYLAEVTTLQWRQYLLFSSSVAPLSKKDKRPPSCSPPSIPILRCLSPINSSHLFYNLFFYFL